jgi:CheY-like chemotaxis protein
MKYNCNVLIVDDVDDNLYLLEDLIEDEFEDTVNIYKATCGKEALSILDGNIVDLVILDILYFLIKL